MRVEMKEDGNLDLMLGSDAEFELVGALVNKRYGAALEALLSDLRPVFEKHGLDAQDPRFLEHGLQPLLWEKLWGRRKRRFSSAGDSEHGRGRPLPHRERHAPAPSEVRPQPSSNCAGGRRGSFARYSDRHRSAHRYACGCGRHCHGIGAVGDSMRGGS